MKNKFLSILIAISIISIPTIARASENISLNRLSGKDRYETSIAIANEFQKQVGSINSVILASGDNFPDALSGTTLCKKYKAPLVLINNKTKNKILCFVYKNLKQGSTVYILGGTGAVDNSIATELNSKGYKVIRLAGNNRFQTNKAIVDQMNVKEGTPVFICNGSGFADALSASPVAGAKGYPIILVNKDSISNETKEQIKKIKPSKFYIVGGTGAVSEENVYRLLNLSTNSTYARIGGQSRYETSQNLNKEFNLCNKEYIAIADGNNYPDALSGAGLASIKEEGIKLVNTNGCNNDVFSENIKTLDVLGGQGIIPDTLIESMDPIAYIEKIKTKSLCNFNMKDNQGKNYSVYVFSNNNHIATASYSPKSDWAYVWAGAKNGDVLSKGNHKIALIEEGRQIPKIYDIKTDYMPNNINSLVLNLSDPSIKFHKNKQLNQPDFLSVEETLCSNANSLTIYYIKNGELKTAKFKENKNVYNSMGTLRNGYFKQQVGNIFETVIYSNTHPVGFYVTSWNFDINKDEFIHMDTEFLKPNEFHK